MHIKNVKSINELNFVFPLEKGLYAITGENGSGKSTLVACASTVFFQMSMYEYFGRPEEEAEISFELDGSTRKWKYYNRKWVQDSSSKKMKLSGFYEGSIIFGNRFKDTNFSLLHVLDEVKESELELAHEFVRKNLGLILHNDENYFQDLLVLKKEFAKKRGLSKSTYYYRSNNGKLVSQSRMSTGENLLVSILNSLDSVQNRRVRLGYGRCYIIFLDEIELALHASALRRLVHFLSRIAEEYEVAIFFSTHSLELIRGIKPQNIYYLERRLDNTISIINPCYPAYATRNLYGDDGYGEDMVILVEDDVAKNIVGAGLAKKCELQLSYAIGVAKPISVMVDTFGTGIVSDDVLSKAVSKVFDLRPAAIIRDLDLRRPIYRQLAAYGHMGREELGVAWEKLDKVDALKKAVKQVEGK